MKTIFYDINVSNFIRLINTTINRMKENYLIYEKKVNRKCNNE